MKQKSVQENWKCWYRIQWKLKSLQIAKAFNKERAVRGHETCIGGLQTEAATICWESTMACPARKVRHEIGRHWMVSLDSSEKNILGTKGIQSCFTTSCLYICT